jgi:hypothetical protein
MEIERCRVRHGMRSRQVGNDILRPPGHSLLCLDAMTHVSIAAVFELRWPVPKVAVLLGNLQILIDPRGSSA